ncbi:MAG: GNAT family N-acetyltransferase [Pseudomonadota bacterium]
MNELTLLRPYADVTPWHLFDEYPSARAEFDEIIRACLDDAPLHFLRVAKRADDIVGVYVMRALEGTDPLGFELCYLLVVPTERRRGLGRWLLRHALGIAESKGGEWLDADSGPLDRFLMAQGFLATPPRLRCRFTPE